MFVLAGIAVLSLWTIVYLVMGQLPVLGAAALAAAVGVTYGFALAGSGRDGDNETVE
jgi:hypothetical protein